MTPPVEIGSVIGGYRIDALLNRGGMGVVYRATNLTLGQVYALKVIAPELAADEQFRERFRREIKLAASLHHPHAVAVHYAGEHDGVLFLAMQLVEGTSLAELLAREGALAPERAVTLVTQIASALDAAHRSGLVHRDLKPANVLVGTDSDGHEHAYLTDFGLAKRIDSRSRYTGTGLVVGTLDYMPPEQVTGARIDARSDIYALGCVFFHMIAGRPPFAREADVATMWAQVHEPPPSVRALRPVLHPAFDEVLHKAMAKDPAERHMSAGDFARDARAALSGLRFEGPGTAVAAGEAAFAGAGAPTVASPAAEPPSTERVQIPAQPPPSAGPALPPPTVGDRVPGSMPPPTPPEASRALPATAPPARGRGGRRALVAAGAMAVAAAIAVALVVALGGSSSSGGGGSSSAGSFPHDTLTPIPTNRVTASGAATVQLNGDVASITVDTNGLLNGAPHAMHIHAFGKGVCPPASAARDHNGHLAISTSNGAPFYGTPVTSLTTSGDTSTKSIISFDRYPTTGAIRYTRKIAVAPAVIAAIKHDDAVIIVHGIDYDHDGVYGNVLSRSELNPTVPAEATAPALCGPLHHAAQGSAYAPRTLYARLRPSSGGGAQAALLCVLAVEGRRPRA